MNMDFWRDKQVLITGHTGFKGGWLSIWLQLLGAKVTGYALSPPTRPSLFEVAGIDKGIHSILADIRDGKALQREFERTLPEIVFHLAAQPLVRYSYIEPVETYATNIMGTVNVLEAVRKTGSVRAMVNITSDKCYENREQQQGYQEGDPMGGHDPYSSSKGCSELITAAWRKSFFNPLTDGQHRVALASARAGNVIGGGDWANDRLIPDMFRSFEAGEWARIRHPDAIRPWQHVLEPLSGYLLLAEKLYSSTDYAQGWNFGPDEGDARPVSWIADRLTRMWGKGVGWKQDEQTHPHEASILRLDSTKARTRLGWKPGWKIDEALGATVEWYQAFSAGARMRQKCEEQIQLFMTAQS